MTPADRQTWADEQMQVLIGLGVTPADARATVRWVLDHAPPDADLGTWIPTPDLLADDLATPLAVSSATPAHLLQ